MTYRVRWVDRATEAPSALWSQGFAPPLEGRWWYETLEASGLEDQFTFFYAVVERNGHAVGLAPVFLADVPIDLVVPDELMPVFRLLGRVLPHLLIQRTLFVGSPCADEGTAAVAEGEDRVAVLEAVARAMPAMARRRKAPMMVWKDFPRSTDAEMAQVARRTGLFSAVSYPGTEVRFASTDKADYFAGMKSSHRQLLRRKLRRSQEQAKLVTEVVQNPPPDVLEELFGLFMQTYERAATRFERLDQRFFARIAAEPVSHFILMRDAADGRMVAFMLCFAQGDDVINKFIGLDYARPKDWMLYFRLWDACVDWCLSRGVRCLQSGQTGYRVKIELGNALVPFTNYARHANPLVNLIYAQVARTISWASLDSDLDRDLAVDPEAGSLKPAGTGRP